MKKTITSIAMCLALGNSIAQIGATAPDFTVTDINGTSHNLYTILNSGKVVVLDVSATWCGPCWGFHTEHFLEEIEAQYGATGTDEVVVLFYEGDAATAANALNGTGGSTQGDWVTGATYPIINESPLQLNLNIYAPTGFPTINVICPSDKKIKEDLWNYYGSDHTTSINAMKAYIDQTITACATGGAGIEEQSTLNEFKVYPNPTNGSTSITISSKNTQTANLNVFSLSGVLNATSMHDLSVGINNFDLDLSKLANGSYFVQIVDNDRTTEMMKVIKQ